MSTKATIREFEFTNRRPPMELVRDYTALSSETVATKLDSR